MQQFHILLHHLDQTWNRQSTIQNTVLMIFKKAWISAGLKGFPSGLFPLSCLLIHHPDFPTTLGFLVSPHHKKISICTNEEQVGTNHKGGGKVLTLLVKHVQNKKKKKNSLVDLVKKSSTSPVVL